MKKVRNIAVIVLSVICVGILAFLLWNLGSTEESTQKIIPEVQPEPMSEQSVSDSDVSGNSAENSGDPTELPETEESEPAEVVDLVAQKAEELLAGMTDRSITLSFALILPDEAFLYYSQGMYDTYVNAVLSEQALDGNSLMTAYLDLNEKLDETGIEYESYLQNIGRQLFYTIASSYITLYLAIVFLVVANTIVGVQFLMSQQKTGRRYQTLIRLGATYETLCQSAGKQITWFMGLPVLVAAVSSLFGVRALFTGILSSRTRGTVSEMLLVSAAMILLLCVIEYIYMRVVKRSSDRYLLTLMQPQREE